MSFRHKLRGLGNRLLFYLTIMGPGLITSSADNDAAGIATYSVAGSHYGYGLLWLIGLITVGEVVMQEMAARMGAVTGKGLADLIRERFGVKITFFTMLGLMIANVGTTAAQFAGVAASLEMAGISRYFAVPLAALLVWLLVTRGSYQRVEKVLLALCMIALAYVASAFLARPSWGEILRQTVTPSFQVEVDYLLLFLAMIGTTIAPWMLFYLQASVVDKGSSAAEYGSVRLDVTNGVIWGNLISAFIIICTAATLFAHGIEVQTAEEAAMALAPLAGRWAQTLFGLGLVGASFLAAAVLPLSTSYAVCEAFGWERGVSRRLEEAPVFYGLYTALILIGAGTVLLPGVPLFRLMWLSQVVNGLLLPFVVGLMIILADDGHLMGRYANGRFSALTSRVLLLLLTVVSGILLLSPILSR